MEKNSDRKDSIRSFLGATSYDVIARVLPGAFLILLLLMTVATEEPKEASATVLQPYALPVLLVFEGYAAGLVLSTVGMLCCDKVT